MADKDYKVQVGVEAKADTRGLDQVNKGLDKVRTTAHRVNEELGDKEVATNLEAVTDAAEETADALDKTSDAAEGAVSYTHLGCDQLSRVDRQAANISQPQSVVDRLQVGGRCV